MKRLLSVAAAATASALVLTGCGGSGGSGGAGSADTLRLGVVVNPTTWNPANADGGANTLFYQALYDSLLRLTPAGDVASGLAKSWSYNADRTVLTLKLREGAKLGDGTAVDSSLVEPNLTSVKSGSGGFAASLASLKSVTATDKTTVELHLSAPDPALLYNLGLGASYILPPSSLKGDGMTTKPAPTGPYSLDAAQTTAGTKYTFTKNTQYWDAASYPYKKLTYTVLPDDTARLNAVKSQQVDVIGGKTTMIDAAKSAGLDVKSAPLDMQGLVIADRAGKTVPALADVRVRQAINYAIDGAGILKSIDKGFGTHTTQIFNPKGEAYDPALNSRYPFDPNKAKQLLAEAGYKNGFTLPMASISPYWGAFEPVFKEQLGAVGIKVKFTTVQPADIISSFAKYPVFMVTWQTAKESYVDVLQMISKTSLINPQKTEDPKVESLVKMMQTGSDQERAAAGRKLSAYLVDQAWFDPWATVNNSVTIGDNSVKFDLQTGNVVPSLRFFTPAS
ncbi:ABC transporter substrate-binding protein [Streptomyces sp. NPDC051001]|uniref:ABC transporter substrate-binding protein n=1 Tax=Streptomyces sp. NPDC051001 TaxID=3155795 RepID=UPI00342C1F77